MKPMQADVYFDSQLRRFKQMAKEMAQRPEIEPVPQLARHIAPPAVFAQGVPKEFHAARLSNFDVDPGNHTALARAKAFLEGTRDLYLSGGVGAGKTRLACSIVNESVCQRRGGTFERVPILLYRLQPGGDRDEIASLEHAVLTSPLLVLDDVGAERDVATDYTRRTLLMIYEERGDRGLRTIWTSNKNLDELAAMQDDDRLVSRIGGRADVVRLSTPDQRLGRR